jgi:bifunctional UDP-N-acetylglucosamine pyrophosphorylase/glucosamine-1-phosphate N-acetyltransferase
MKNVAVIIMAAGKGKRMRSHLIKVLHPVLGKPMLSFTVEVVFEHLQPEKVVVIVGHQARTVRDTFPDRRITFIEQKEQLGTGHAVTMTEPILADFKGTILILSGDTPLISAQTLAEMVQYHQQHKAALTLLTAHQEDPTGYGRVVRSAAGKVRKVVEEQDASKQELKIQEVNTGIYCVETPFLYQSLATVRADNAQGEYYLPDIIASALRKKQKVKSFPATGPMEGMGINTRAELAHAEAIMAERVRKQWMNEGVTIHDPGSVYIEPSAHIGRDTVIHPNCYLRGRTIIGEGCRIGPQVEIIDSQIGDRVEVRFCSLITESRIADDAVIGPFSHLRPACHVEKGAKIGNFVEVKKSRIGPGTKANHLAYIGDADIGAAVNIGAGTITCNYDGRRKHRTIIEDRVFVGSNTALVAPVKLGAGAVIAAGSTVTKDVPPQALAVGRARQKSIKKWVVKREKKNNRGRQG